MTSASNSLTTEMIAKWHEVGPRCVGVNSHKSHGSDCEFRLFGAFGGRDAILVTSLAYDPFRNATLMRA